MNVNITVGFFMFKYWTFVTQFFIHKIVDYTALIILFNVCQPIYHNFMNQEQTNFYLVLKIFFCSFFSKTVRLNTIMLMLYQLLPHHFSLLHNQIQHILFPLNLNKSLEQTENYKKGIFANFPFSSGVPA